MRIHMVTPKAPVRVTLNPKVQPAPNAPIFLASADQPIVLTQSAYWVLRLPYPFKLLWFIMVILQSCLSYLDF